jgi:hypothetical protein
MATLSAPNPFAHSFGTESFYRVPEHNVHTPRAQLVAQDQSDPKRSEAFTSPKSQPPRAPSSPAVFVSDNYVVDALPKITADAPARDYFMRCVVIGQNDTGKHAILSSNFGEEYHQDCEKPVTDLLMKTKRVFKTTKKYHFWVQTLGNTSAAKEAIWKTYYKAANAFVFVYDTTNKESFEALEKAVQEVLKVVPQEKFFGILVGTKNDMYVDRQVEYEEALDFKSRYNFSHFIETCSSVEEDTPQLLPRLYAKLKLTFEEI